MNMLLGVALIITLVLIGAGIVVGLMGCAVLFLFVTTGVVTSSTVFGMLRGNVRAGFRALWYQCAVLGGIIAGLMCVFTAQIIFAAWERGAEPWLAGALGGGAGALSLALMIDFLLRKAGAWLGRKY